MRTRAYIEEHLFFGLSASKAEKFISRQGPYVETTTWLSLHCYVPPYDRAPTFVALSRSLGALLRLVRRLAPGVSPQKPAITFFTEAMQRVA